MYAWPLRRPYAYHISCCNRSNAAVSFLQMHQSTCLSTLNLKCVRALGRLALRDSGRTIAVGVVTELLQLS